MPPRGVLKRRAMPAAAPAHHQVMRVDADRGDSQRRACTMTAGTHLHGRALTADRQPASSRRTPGRSCAAHAQRHQPPELRIVQASSSARITCGMPEPIAPGT